MSTLKELSIQSNDLIRMLIESDGEITQEIQAYYDEIPKQLSEKVDNYAHAIEGLESKISQLKQLSDQIKSARESFELHLDKMKSRIKDSMVILDTQKLQGNIYSFTTFKSKETEVDERLLPKEYFIIEMKADKKRIRAELLSGKDIPGAALRENTNIKKGIKK